MSAKYDQIVGPGITFITACSWISRSITSYGPVPVAVDPTVLWSRFWTWWFCPRHYSTIFYWPRYRMHRKRSVRFAVQLHTICRATGCFIRFYWRLRVFADQRCAKGKRFFVGASRLSWKTRWSKRHVFSSSVAYRTHSSPDTILSGSRVI